MLYLHRATEMLYLQNGQGNALSAAGPRKCSIYRTAKEMLYLHWAKDMLYLQNGQGNTLSTFGSRQCSLSTVRSRKCSICTGPRKCSTCSRAKEMLHLQNGQRNGQENALSAAQGHGNALSTAGPLKCSIYSWAKEMHIYRTVKEMLYLTVTPPFEAPITPREQRDKRLGQGTQRSVTATCSPARPAYTTLCTGAVPTLQSDPVLIIVTNADNREGQVGLNHGSTLRRTLFYLRANRPL